MPKIASSSGCACSKFSVATADWSRTPPPDILATIFIPGCSAIACSKPRTRSCTDHDLRLIENGNRALAVERLAKYAPTSAPPCSLFDAMWLTMRPSCARMSAVNTGMAASLAKRMAPPMARESTGQQHDRVDFLRDEIFDLGGLHGGVELGGLHPELDAFLRGRRAQTALERFIEGMVLVNRLTPTR